MPSLDDWETKCSGLEVIAESRSGEGAALFHSGSQTGE